MRLYVETGDRKFLEPVPRAVAYLRRSALADGRLARFNELQTNQPLYFTRQYELTYDDSDMPTHYGFKVDNGLDKLAQQYERLSQLTGEQLAAIRQPAKEQLRVTPKLETQVRETIAALDERGTWVEDGRLRYHGKADDTRRVIESTTFIKNIGLLSQYLSAQQR
jgi:hypothetical protein